MERRRATRFTFSLSSFLPRAPQKRSTWARQPHFHESQHHHLLHCLENHCESQPSATSLLIPDPLTLLYGQNLLSVKSCAHILTLGQASEVKVCPLLDQKSSNEVSINPQKEDPSDSEALPCSGTEEAIPLDFPHNPSIFHPHGPFLSY